MAVPSLHRTKETIDKWKIKVPKGRCLNTGITHFKKGHTWNKNKPMSEETKKKISDSKKANPTRYWLGKKRDPIMIEETRKKLIGRKAWNKGKHQWQTSGEKNPNWNGGTSKGYKNGYYSLEYKKWRISVFERDGYMCQGCEIVGGYLTAHHIKSFAHFPKLRFEISNGITLCEKCHELTDNYKGRKKKK